MGLKKFHRTPEGDLVLPIPEAADFRPVKLLRTFLCNSEEVTMFRRTATAECRQACGNAACAALLYIETSSIGASDIREPEHALLYCASADCPLDEPPAHDNEPLKPAPTPPSLMAEATLAG